MALPIMRQLRVKDRKGPGDHFPFSFPFRLHHCCHTVILSTFSPIVGRPSFGGYRGKSCKPLGINRVDSVDNFTYFDALVSPCRPFEGVAGQVQVPVRSTPGVPQERGRRSEPPPRAGERRREGPGGFLPSGPAPSSPFPSTTPAPWGTPYGSPGRCGR